MPFLLYLLCSASKADQSYCTKSTQLEKKNKNTVGGYGVMVCVVAGLHTSLTYKDYNKPGISRVKTMAYKFIYIPNDDIEIIPYVDYDLWLKLLSTHFNEPMTQNIQKLLSKRIRKRCLKLLGLVY